MFYLPLAVITWLSVRWIIRREQWRGLLIYGLFGAVLATVQDRLVLLYRLWEYRDTGPVHSHAEVALLISLSAAPIFAMRFAQRLRPAMSVPWRRVFKFTAISMAPEIVGLYTGHIVYHQWWNVGWSVLAYMPIWTSIWALHRWLHSPVSLPARARVASDT